ncbi:MAG: hypothetical protein ACTHQM_00150 [Thermoanaerobaculia bacterium]
MTSLATLAFVVLAAATPMKATPLSGDVVVRTIGEDRVAVLVDSDSDSKIDQGFLLSSDLPVSRMSVFFKSAHLEFTDAYVRLISENKLYDLHVTGHPEPPAAPKDMRAVRFIGYALQHSTGDGRCTVTDAREGDVGACFAYGEN